MGDVSTTEISYWPMFRAALAAALVTVAAQVVGVVWFGLQAGAEVQLDRFWMLPHLKVITTSVAVFNSIVKWSTIATAAAVTVFATEAFVRERQLQTQLGRAFGFLDLALLAGLHLWGERINPGASLPTRLIVYILALGAIGFVLCAFLVGDIYRERSNHAALIGRQPESAIGKQTVAADTIITNDMVSSMGVGDQGIEAYAYGTGIDHRFDSAAGFADGAITGPGSVVGDTVEIDGVPVDEWWDERWQKRQCFVVSAGDSRAQYPVRVVVDTTGQTIDDIRVVVLVSPASSATPLPHYTEPVIGTAQTVVWFQAPIGPQETYCIYFESGESSTSMEFAPFSYDASLPVSYYTMTDAYSGSGVNGQVQVISYVDNNVVSDGTTTVTLNTGAIHVFAGMDAQGTITATGPIDASFDRLNRESLLPEGFADSLFTFPTNRQRQEFWVRSRLMRPRPSKPLSTEQLSPPFW